MNIVIFANGQLLKKDRCEQYMRQADRVIAADGGAAHCSACGIVPDLLIGDLDSIDPHLLKTIETAETTIHRHPPRKDATDLELCLDFAVERGAAKIHVLAALGGRWDMSLANIQLCTHKKYKHASITLVGDDCIMDILHPGNAYTLSGSVGTTVSLLPLGQKAEGITLTGFTYPLNKETITFGSSRGVSNVIKQEPATVRLNRGILLCIQSL